MDINMGMGGHNVVKASVGAVYRDQVKGYLDVKLILGLIVFYRVD